MSSHETGTHRLSFRFGLGFAAFCLVWIVSTPRAAEAYQIHSAITDDCHERITLNALRRYREKHGLEATFTPSRSEKTVIRDAPFPVSEGLDDLGAVTLALANRSVDLRGNEPDDLDQLAQLHGNPSHQSEHCLRRPDDNGSEGAKSAIAACRATILRRIDAAISLETNIAFAAPQLRGAPFVYPQYRATFGIQWGA